jgi:hypothetical protein
MSNIGLNANTFQLTGKYLDLLNDFIVNARINPAVIDVKKDQLLEFINKVIDENNTQPQYQLLSSIIERELRLNSKPASYLGTIPNEIEADDVNALLPKIEFLAEVLDNENNESLMKIRGDW